jgi:hypothetical protein
MTLAQLEALEGRRRIELRHSRFNAALVASTIINSRRTEDSDAVSPFDFLPGFETSPEDTEKAKTRRSIKKGIKMSFTGQAWTPETLQAEKARMVKQMADNGIEDPEGIIREVEEEAGL